MHELGAMQRQTASLRQQLLANNATLQGVGTAFAARLEEVQQVVALQQGVAEARKVGAGEGRDGHGRGQDGGAALHVLELHCSQLHNVRAE
jgi:hypothetical protein